MAKAVIGDMVRASAPAAVLDKLGIAYEDTPEEAVKALEEKVAPKTSMSTGRLDEVKAPDPQPQSEPQGIGLPKLSKEAAGALKQKSVKIFKTKEGRVRLNAGYFVFSPPEDMECGKNYFQSYNPQGWAGWSITGWVPKRP